MKKLLVIRHAKSSWDHPELSDFDRPLNKRGLRNAPEMGLRLQKRKITVGALLTSTAARAQHTAKLLAEPLGLHPENIAYHPGLYLAMPAVYTQHIHWLDNGIDSAAIVGHNPDLTEWVNALALTDIMNIPTCGMVYLSFPKANTWQEVGPGKAKQVWLDYPKKKFVK